MKEARLQGGLLFYRRASDTRPVKSDRLRAVVNVVLALVVLVLVAFVGYFLWYVLIHGVE